MEVFIHCKCIRSTYFFYLAWSVQVQYVRTIAIKSNQIKKAGSAVDDMVHHRAKAGEKITLRYNTVRVVSLLLHRRIPSERRRKPPILNIID